MLLCRTCHKWVHQNPVDARAEGYIVPTQVDEPSTVTFKAWWGRVSTDCKGGIDWVGKT